MSLQLVYWILMLVWLLALALEARAGWQLQSPPWGRILAGNLLVFLLLLVLGWAQFGAPIKG